MRSGLPRGFRLCLCGRRAVREFRCSECPPAVSGINAKFWIPWRNGLSKNAMWEVVGKRIKLTDEAATTKDIIAYEVALATKGQAARQEKLWLSIFVAKPRECADAVNVIDVLCDGIEKGTGLNDRFFAIRRLDWVVDADRPRVEVEMSQLIVEAVGTSEVGGSLAPVEQGSAEPRRAAL